MSYKSIIPSPMKKLYRQLIYLKPVVLNLPRCLINKYLLRKRLIRKLKQLHIGCGTIRMTNFLNVDYRPTKATDFTNDCSDLSIFPPSSFSTVYSNAFFEHLHIEDRERCLMSVYRVLKADGTIVFIGIPDFEIIAQSYLNKEPGLTSEIFNLYHVYGYTHGKPELSPDFWNEQLHKTLFDKETTEKLLLSGGFSHFCIFNYCFRDELIPLNIGFVGFKQKPVEKITAEWLTAFLGTYTSDINKTTIQIKVTRLD